MSLDRDNPPSLDTMRREYIEAMSHAILAHNSSVAAKEFAYKVPEQMPAAIAAKMLSWLNIMLRIDLADGENSEAEKILYRYDEVLGIYVEVDEVWLGVQVGQLNIMATLAYEQKVYKVLRDNAALAYLTRDPNLVAVKNGILDLRTKDLIPFSPDFKFISKTAIDWVDNPPLPVIHNDEDGTDWDIESGMLEWADGDEDVSEFLWDVGAASIRNNVRWNRSIWFHSNWGCSAKGTYCSAIRNILGPGNYISISFAEFSNKDFMLDGIQNVQAVICDENQVGHYVDENETYKAAVTGDVFRVNRKHKKAISVRFLGLIIECINEVPRVRDKSDSFWRRIVVVTFEKNYANNERPYIKNDYMKRQDVLEYMQWRMLSKDFDKLDVPDKCALALSEFKAFSDPLRTFVDEVIPRLRWNGWPAEFLYDLYRAWMLRTNENGRAISYQRFRNEMVKLMEERGYEFSGRGKFTTSVCMVGAEPMILEYGLTHWMNQSYKGLDASRKATPSGLAKQFRGWKRSVFIDAEEEDGSDV